MNIKREQFIWDFYKNGKAIIPNCFEHISYKKQKWFNEKLAKEKNVLPKVVYVSLFPDFLEAKLDKDSYYVSKKIIHYGFSGAGILLDQSDSVEAYLKKNTKRSFQDNLKRLIKRLEKDYEISYEYNYGDISEEKCDLILNALRAMINKRFENRGVTHVFLMEWESNTKDLAELIRQKKSSIFVVYDGDKPISISVNRHIFNTIFFSETHSFDSEYSIYGLGNLNNYISIDWCLKNKLSFLDIGIGVTPYKTNWCNTFYDLQYLIYYKKNSTTSLFIAYIEIFKIAIKNSLKKLRDKIIININKFIKKNRF